MYEVSGTIESSEVSIPPSSPLSAADSDAPHEPVLEASLRAADAVGRLVEFWGFSRHIGRAYTTLYLSEEPLATSDLAERLGLSSSATAAILGELQGWHGVRKVWRTGERRVFWEADASPWRVVRGVLGQREAPLLADALRELSEAEALLRSVRRGRRGAKFARRRLAGLRFVTKTAQGVVLALADGRPSLPKISSPAESGVAER